MGLSSRLKDIAVKLERKNNSIFEYPVVKQKEYLEHFSEPKDNIERAYFQFRCQMKMNNPIINIIINLASLPLLLICRYTRNNTPNKKNGIDSVFFSDGKPSNIIPSDLVMESGNIEVINEKKDYLSEDGKRFFKILVRRYPISFQFLLKCLMKIKYYDYEIERTSPAKIIVCNEYSFTSSAMTEYCHLRNTAHINVMHGEKLYYIRDSFFCFDKCYVWDQYYKELFCSLRAENSQFIIAVPDSLVFKNKSNVKKVVDYTYYLAAETDDELDCIIELMKKLQSKGFSVSIRPHPRYTDTKKLANLQSIEIENVNKMTIEDSVSRTKNAIACYSTVLNQAYHNGVSIVIDNVTFPSKYNKLKEVGYIMMMKEHKLLSDIVAT